MAFILSPFKAPVRSGSCNIGSGDAVVTPGWTSERLKKPQCDRKSRVLGAWRGVRAPTPELTPCSLADPRHSSSLLNPQTPDQASSQGGGADGEAQTGASVTSEGDVSPNVRLAWRETGIWSSSEVERDGRGEQGGGGVRGAPVME